MQQPGLDLQHCHSLLQRELGFAGQALKVRACPQAALHHLQTQAACDVQEKVPVPGAESVLLVTVEMHANARYNKKGGRIQWA